MKIRTLNTFLEAGVELPTSPYTSKDKGGLVNLPNNYLVVWLPSKGQCVIHPTYSSQSSICNHSDP